MIKLLRKSKIFIFIIILINTSSLIASEMPNNMLVTTIPDSDFQKDDIFRKLFNEDETLSYDAVISFLEDLENEKIQVSSKEDWDKINQFIVFLSKQGIMPDTTDEEKMEIEKDIDELLKFNKDAIIYQNTLYDVNNYQIIPCIFYDQGEIVYCKSWVKKQCQHIAKFVHKHKTVVIVGAVIVVAAVAVVATVAIATSTAAASAAATTAADSSYKPKEEKKEEEKATTNESNTPLNKTSVDLSDPSLQKSFDNQLSSIKNRAIENNLQLKPNSQNYPYRDNQKVIGSVLAHDAINNIPNIQNNNQDLIIQGHGKIDNAFSTYQTPFYTNYNKLFNSSETLQENVFYFQGLEALKAKCYDQAIDNFGKALEINPNNHDIYLDRGYAYLKNCEFDKSLNDYHHYTMQNTIDTKKTNTFVNCIDFSLGFSSGIVRGAKDSGENLISFAATAVSHPVDTSISIYEGFSSLAKLALTNEWKDLSKTLAPEICDTINQWESLSPKEKGDRSGYIVGKYGVDFLLPGVAIKCVSQGIKGAEELVTIAKNLQKTEEVMVLKALAETGGSSGTFAETITTWKTTEVIPKSLEKNIINLITSKSLGSSSKIIDSLIKETFENKGYFTSKYGLTYNEALEAGIKFLGDGYKEIGTPGSGVYRSADGLRQFRIDKASLEGNHSPNVSHFHLELLEKDAKKPVAINHIILLE